MSASRELRAMTYILLLRDKPVRFPILLMAALLCGCAAQKPKAAVPAQQVIERVPGHPGYHYGPEHWECDAANNCELVRSWLDKDGKPVLTPLGCVLAHTPIGWIFGDRPNMCEKKP